MDKILDRFGSLPADFWLLLIAIPLFVTACILLRIAKGHRYKDFDNDGEFFASTRIGIGLDSSDANDELFGGLSDEGSHH